MKRKPADGKKSSVLRALLLCLALTVLCGGLGFAASLPVFGIVCFVFAGLFLVALLCFFFFAPKDP